MSEVAEQKSVPKEQQARARHLTPPSRPRPSRGRWVFPVIVVLLIAAVLGGVIFYLRYMRGSSVRYIQQTVRVGNLQVTASATGPIQSKAVYNMNFSNAGQIQAIDVHVGQSVTAGQTLATLNKGPAMTAPENAVVAEINGVVGENVSNSGSVSGASSGSGSGSSGSQPFMILTDTSALNITAQVNEADIEQIKAGQAAQFTVPAYPNQTFKATVSAIETYGQTSSNVVSYPVNLAVDKTSLQGANLYPGMTATVNIVTSQATNVLLVPNSALTFPSQALQSGELSRSALRSIYGQGGANGGSTSSQGKRGMVLELQNGQLTPVLVYTGLTDGQYTQILSGLNEGDSIVTSQVGGQTGTSSLPGGGGGFGGGGAGRGGFGGGGGAGRSTNGN